MPSFGEPHAKHPTIQSKISISPLPARVLTPPKTTPPSTLRHAPERALHALCDLYSPSYTAPVSPDTPNAQESHQEPYPIT